MDCRTQGTFPNLHRGHQPWPGKKSWLCHVKHMGKPMSMLPSPGKETISHHWKTWEKKNIKIIKGHGGYKSRLKRNNPSTKKRGVRWDGSDSKFSTLPIRGFAKDFFGNFKEPFLLIPKFNCLKLNKSLSRNSQKSISAFF